jgi:hypothetical protein
MSPLVVIKVKLHQETLKEYRKMDKISGVP